MKSLINYIREKTCKGFVCDRTFFLFAFVNSFNAFKEESCTMVALKASSHWIYFLTAMETPLPKKIKGYVIMGISMRKYRYLHTDT